MKRSFLLFAALLCSLLAPGFALAHPTPSSIAFVDFTVDGALIEQDVPIEELERAQHRRLLEEGESPAQMLLREGSSLQTYALEHLSVVTQGKETPWAVEITRLTGHVAEDGARVVFRFVARAPHGEASTSVRIHDDLVAHEVVSHYTQIYVRHDWFTDAEYASPQLAGMLHAGQFDIDIARSGSFWSGFRGVVKLGMEHIASGMDHVLFVLVLLLAAPVTAVRGRWRGQRTERETMTALAVVISAFTLGHSATLILGALGWVVLSPAIVEPAIAISIIVTALHAWRPIFPRREMVVAGGFGLVHGLAFASSLPREDLGGAQTAYTLLGFNVGIELGQLVLLALVLPWILLLARTPAFAPFRSVTAAAAGLLAFGWLVERIAAIPNPAAPPVAWLETHPMQLLVALASLTLIARMRFGDPVAVASPSANAVPD